MITTGHTNLWRRLGALGALVVLLASCSRDETADVRHSDDDRIRFSVEAAAVGEFIARSAADPAQKGAATAATEAATAETSAETATPASSATPAKRVAPFTLSEPFGDPVSSEDGMRMMQPMLSIGVAEAPASGRGIFGVQAAQRGVGYDNATKKLRAFTALALVSSTGQTFFDAMPITVGGNNVGVTDRFWPEATPLTFFAHAASHDYPFTPAFASAEGTASGSFTFAQPTMDGKADATLQPDLVVAVAANKMKEGSANGLQGLNFHHALAAVTFRVGKMPAGVMIRGISLESFYGAGSCTMGYAARDEDGTADNVLFTWTPSGAADKIYTQEFTVAGTEGAAISTLETTFMMVPQTMDTAATLALHFDIEGREYTLRKPFSELNTREWKADHNYLYTIGIGREEIAIEVEDKVVKNIKSDLTIQNTGFATGYIRAAVVANWINADDQVVAPWLPSHGEFVRAADWADHWVEGADGFYYHKAPVEGAGFTAPLFESYTVTIPAPVAGATLKMDIVAQIVVASAVGEAWTIPTN